MILDDEYDLVTILKLGLERRGFHVISFTDPLLALEHFRLNAVRYDLVISDLRMQAMNGLEFLTKVKNFRANIKTFLMTAFEVNLLFVLYLPSVYQKGFRLLVTAAFFPELLYHGFYPQVRRLSRLIKGSNFVWRLRNLWTGLNPQESND